MAVLIDDIFGAPVRDPFDAGADVFLPPHDGGEAWPIQYTFDTDLEGWEIAPDEFGPFRPKEALVRNAENAAGGTASGSLEVQRRFDPWNTDAAVYPTKIRVFTADGGTSRDWRGYRIAATAKVVPGSAHCFTSAYFYVRTANGGDVNFSRPTFLSQQEWRSMTYELPVDTSFFDASQVVELGIAIDRDLCIPD